MKFQTHGAASWLRKTLKELVHGWTSTASIMSGSSLFQGSCQVPDGFWLQCAVHTGWGSGDALSCWVCMVAEARDKNRDTREGGSTASVPPSQVELKRGESYLVLRLVCASVSWRLFPGVLCEWAAVACGLLFRFCV